MFMVTDTLKIGLLTDHVAVKDVSAAIIPRLIRDKINTIEKSLKANTAEIIGDKIHLTNVVFNLLDNAVKYSIAPIIPAEIPNFVFILSSDANL